MKKLLDDFPFVSVETALMLFRLALAAVFVGHAGMRLYLQHDLAQSAESLAIRGVPFSMALAWLVTVFELLGGVLLVLNRYTRWIALGFFLISVATMALVQVHAGWWVAEYGDGGMEFSAVVCAMCLFLAAVDRAQQEQRQPEETGLPVRVPQLGLPTLPRRG
ncbi:DoxX family protein [Paucibacter sp. DJ1R-11]|nr:DoxX family protein [Paucibacter sp. DJ1R-11]